MGNLTPILRLFIFFGSVFLLFFLVIKNSGYKYRKKVSEFWDTEHKANSAPKQEIPESAFYVANMDRLPISEYENTEDNKIILNIQKDVQNASNKKMLQFEEDLTNTELKLKYGASNIQNIVVYEQNYVKFIRALNSWAEELIKRNNITDAETVLEVALDMKPMIFETYSNLINLYVANKNKSKLNVLSERIYAMKMVNEDDFLKNKINNAIKSALSEI